MQDKTLYVVTLPAANKSFELWIPDELSIHEATRLTQSILEEQEKKQFKAGATTSLYLKSNGAELDADKPIGEFDFVNGTELVLI